MTDAQESGDLLDNEFVSLLLTLFNDSPDAILVVDETGVIRHVNNQAQLLFGYHRTELKGQTVELLIPDALKTRHGEHRARYSEDPKLRPMGYGLELRAKKKNGVEISVEINLSPVSTPNGMRVIATIRRKGAAHEQH